LLVLDGEEAVLLEALAETGEAIEKLLAERHRRLAPHLYSPTVPLDRLTGATAVTLVADETVLREALRRVRDISRAVIAEAEDGRRPGLARTA
jgi:hypothetical protein